ncbi:hypothetical protein D043_1074A, partial [Vibrio parahaemolyticus EKP-021]
MQTQSESHH